jgi:hypothetical protein
MTSTLSRRLGSVRYLSDIARWYSLMSSLSTKQLLAAGFDICHWHSDRKDDGFTYVERQSLDVATAADENEK